MCEDSALADYASRLHKLASLRLVFDAYASVDDGGGQRRMTRADFLTAMLCYTYVRATPEEVRRRCSWYDNPLVGDSRALVSFREFVLLVRLISIPDEHFHVAFEAMDEDGSGAVDRAELETVLNRLVPADSDARGTLPATPPPEPPFAGLFSREQDGAEGTVCRERLEKVLQGLRRDVRLAELRLYSGEDGGAKREPPAPAPLRGGPERTVGGLPPAGAEDRPQWWRLGGMLGGGRAGPRRVGQAAAEEGVARETIALRDLGLTLVSRSDPSKLRPLLARVAGVHKGDMRIPLEDALMLLKILEDHAGDLGDALRIYAKGSPLGVIAPAEFRRAAVVVSSVQPSDACVQLVFDLFDEDGDGLLSHMELLRATRLRCKRVPSTTRTRPPEPGLQRFMACVQGKE